MLMKENVEVTIGRKAARTFYPSMIGKFVGLLITVLTFIAMARLLGSQGFGLFTLAVSYAALLGASSTFGVAMYFTKSMSEFSFKNDAKELANELVNGFASLIPIAVVCSLLGVVFSGYVSNVFLQNTGIEQFTLLIISADIFFSIIWGASYQAMIGLGEGRRAGASLVLSYLSQLIFGVSLILAGYGVNGAVSGVLIGDMVGVMVTTIYLRRSLRRYGRMTIEPPRLAGVKRVFAFAIPLAIIELLGAVVTNFAPLLLGWYTNASVVGNYGIALQGFGVLVIIYDTLSLVLLQAFSAVLSTRKRAKKTEVTYNNSLFYCLFLMCPLIIFVGVFSQPIMYLLLGTGFGLAPALLTLMAISSVPLIVVASTRSFYLAAEKVKELLVCASIATVIQLAALLVLTPVFYATGLVVAVFLIWGLVYAALLIIGMKRIFRINMRFKKLINILVADLVVAMFASCVLLLNNYVAEIIVGFVLIALIYPPLLVVFRAIDRQSLLNLKAHVERIPFVETIVGYLTGYTNIFVDVLDAGRRSG
jgi:O-antigen/teichoic acid export membrane protein